MTLKCEDARVRDTGVGTKGNENADVSPYAEQNPNLQVLTCARSGCNNVIEQSRRGRTRKYCSRRCQQRAFRSRSERDEIAPQWVIADSPKTEFRYKQNQCVRGAKKPISANASLSWVAVNDITFKLTD